MPHALEFPGMRRAVVPLVRPCNAFINELVSHRLPRLAAIVRALNHLPGPAAGLRCIQTIWVHWRPFEVINLPARKMGAVDIPMLPFTVRRQDKCALARTNQYPYFAHAFPFSVSSMA